MSSRVKAIAHRFRREDAGQSLVIIAVSMTVIVAIAAFAIDAASWYQTHHRAQVAADAAALAAANYMAQNGASASTGTATTTATTYVTNNGMDGTNTNVAVNTTNGTVTVSVPATGALVFAGALGISGPSISATATASWGLTGTNCTTHGSGCSFIFAADTSCATGHYSVTIATNGTPDTFNGGVHSNGQIKTSSTGNPSFNAYPTYSSSAGCNPPAGTGANNYTHAAVAEAPISTWPIDYSKIYVACSGSSCTGPNGTPSYCTYAAASFSNPTNPGVYCAYGTSGTRGDPTTWNGTITSGGQSGETFIGGQVTISSSGNTPISPYGSNRLLAWATQSDPSGGSALSVGTSGTESLGGDLFAPNGTANVTMGGTPTSGNLGVFIEAYDVVFSSNGTPSADGPSDDSSGNPITQSTDSLTG